jgi:hypothetical protein
MPKASAHKAPVASKAPKTKEGKPSGEVKEAKGPAETKGSKPSRTAASPKDSRGLKEGKAVAAPKDIRETKPLKGPKKLVEPEVVKASTAHKAAEAPPETNDAKPALETKHAKEQRAAREVKEIVVKAINFKCQFCGEERPLDQMVILRQYFPPKSACKECARTI